MYTSLTEITEIIHDCFRKLGCETLVGTISVSFNGRFTSRMGDAHYSNKAIRLSKPLWPIASPEERLQTIIHEACHIVADHLYNRRFIQAHGREWKRLMIRMGCDPKRCHNVPTESIKKGTKRDSKF